jgi:outer membrane protein OmpA-like peptidoglycan-associated protein
MSKPQKTHIEYVNKVLRLKEDDENPLITDEKVRSRALELMISEEEWDELLREFREFSNRGQNHLRHNNYEDALLEFQNALLLNPNDANVLYLCADANYGLWKEKEHNSSKSQAIEYAGKCLEIYPSHDGAANIISLLKKEKNKPFLSASTRTLFWKGIKNLFWVGVVLGGLYYYNFRKNKKLQQKTKHYKGEEFILKDVVFDAGSIVLSPSAKTELDHLVRFLNKNVYIEGILEGHTDNVGYPAQNQAISEQRAKIVYDYLSSMGISQTRIKYLGFGDTKPTVKNDSEFNRAKNRRIDFKITRTTKIDE